MTRARMRAERLRHRAVYVTVVDGSDRLVVHQRAAWKDVWPSAWDLAFGGVLGAGEDWSHAAVRELAEEAGLRDVPLVPIGELSYADADVDLVGCAYVAVTDDEVVPSDGEVVAVDRVPLAAVRAWLADRPVCADSVTGVLPLLERWAAAR
ncbi:MAG: NUDIX domain-containing protein [Acidimicrobiales bacterium]